MKRSQEELARLLEAWLENDLDEDDETTIATLLASDDADGRFFRLEAAWAGELAQVLRGTEPDAILAALRESRRSPSVGRRLVDGVDAFRQRRRRRHGLLVAAALLLAFAGLGWWWIAGPGPEPGRVLSAERAWVDRHAARPGQAVHAGASLRTAADGQLAFALDDGSRLTLAGETRLHLTRTTGWQIDQAHGRCRYDIRPQPQALVVTTEQARYTVLGTRFELHSGRQQNLLTVDTGLVRVEGVGGVSDCPAGGYVRLADDGTMQSGPRLHTDARLSAWNLTALPPATDEVADLQQTLPLHPTGPQRHDARGWQPTPDSHLVSPADPNLRHLVAGRRFSLECWFSIDATTEGLRFGEIAAMQILDAPGRLQRELQFRAPAKWWLEQPIGTPLHLIFVFTDAEQTFYANGTRLARLPRTSLDYDDSERFRFRLSGRGLDDQGKAFPLPITIMAAALYHDALDDDTAARHYRAGPTAPGWGP